LGRNEARGTRVRRCNSFAVDRVKRPSSPTFTNLMWKKR
jgi:hypothetical protein